MKSPRLQILALTLLALALRVIQLDAQPLWWDEGYSVFFATRSFGEMLARTAVDIHPPLYYAYLQVWIALFGSASVILRLSSVLVGVLAIPLAYWTFRPLASQRIAVLTSLLLALAPVHIFYSQEIRMYGMLTLFALASFGFLVRILNAQASNTRVPFYLWCGYVLALTAAVYTEYFGAFIVGAEIVIVVFYLSRSQSRLRLPSSIYKFLFAWFAVFVLYLPWLIYAAQKLQTYVANKQGIEQYRALDLLTYVANHLTAFAVGHLSGMTWLAWVGAILFLAIIIFGIVYSRTLPITLSPALFLVASVVFGFILNLVYPFHPARYERLLLFTAPMFYFLAALGIVALANWQRGVAFASFGAVVVVCGIAAFNFYSVPRYTEEDYRALIQTLHERATNEDAILAVYPWQIGYLEAYWRAHPTVLEAPSDAWVNDPDRRDADLQKMRSQYAHVWLMAYQTQGRIVEAEIENYFAADYFLTDEWFGNTRLEEFARADDPTISSQAIPFKNNVTLAEFGAEPTRVRAGQDFVLVYLRWQTNSNEYNYSLRLVDASGRTLAQQDAPIFSDPPIQRRGLFIPANVAKGDYSLQLVVYHAQNGQPINSVDGRTSVELLRLSVE